MWATQTDGRFSCLGMTAIDLHWASANGGGALQAGGYSLVPQSQKPVQELEQLLLLHAFPVEEKGPSGRKDSVLMANAIPVVDRPAADGMVDDLKIMGIEPEICLPCHGAPFTCR